MAVKKNFELEFILRTSPKVLNNLLFTPNGLADWFCDDVDVKEDIYTFHWEGYVEEARLLSSKPGQYIKWIWMEDEDEGHDTHFGFKYHIDPITKAVILTVNASAEENEEEEATALWQQQIGDLKRLIGA